MLIQLALASVMVLTTVLIHLVGLAFIIRVIRSERPLIMLGWSTAVLASLLSQLKIFGHDWLTPTS